MALDLSPSGAPISSWCWGQCSSSQLAAGLIWPLPCCKNVCLPTPSLQLAKSLSHSVQQLLSVLFHNLESLVFKQCCLSYRMLNSASYHLLLKDSKLVYSEHFTMCISFSFHFAKFILLFRLAKYFALLVYFIYWYVFGKREYNIYNFTVL